MWQAVAFDEASRFPLTVQLRRTRLANYRYVTCANSAESRGIPLHAELKSIAFVAADHFVMAHVPGDRFVDEHALGEVAGPVSLMTIAQLKRYGLEKGRVNPFTAKRYLGPNVLHLICYRVFENELVHTNNDRLGGWISFKPQDLLHWVESACVHPVSIAARPQSARASELMR